MSRHDKFIQNRYPDGDVDYAFPKWRRIVDEQSVKTSMNDFNDLDIQDHMIKPDEVALKHLGNNSIVKISDEGYIDIFAGEEVGIRIDPATKSINLFGDSINLFGKNVRFKTQANGLEWNDSAFNSQLYTEDQYEKDKTLRGSKKTWVHTDDKGWHWQEEEWDVKPFTTPRNKKRYSEGMIEILKDLGLPVDDID